MSETVWAVDGSFFAQRLSGIQRYSIELLAEFLCRIDENTDLDPFRT